MRLGWLVVVGSVAGALAPVGATPSGRPTGRIERIERARMREALRFCDLRTNGDKPVICFGEQPRVGDTIDVLDKTHRVAQLRVTEVHPVGEQCAMSEVTFTPGGALPAGDAASELLGVIGGNFKPTGWVRKAEPRDAKLPGIGEADHLMMAADREGDGNADIAVTRRECDGGFCLAIWQSVDRVFTQVSLLRNLERCFDR